MISNNTVVTIDSSTSLVVAVNKEEKVGLFEFKNQDESPIRVSIIFGDTDSVDTVIGALQNLKEKLGKATSKILTPDKNIVVAK